MYPGASRDLLEPHPFLAKMAAPTLLQDVTGFRGEKIVELCLTEYSAFARPLFRPGFLGDKWPAVDFYVELSGVRGRRPYFLIQTKSTSLALAANAASLRISSTRNDARGSFRFPGRHTSWEFTNQLAVSSPNRSTQAWQQRA
jgi:hypothetical protein